MRLFNQVKNRLSSIKEKLFLSFILLQSLLISQSAVAQTGQNSANGLFPVPAGDLSVQMLSKLFGGLINGGSDPLLDLITTFNGCVLAIGGVLVAYTIFAGTIGTAHEGEMLGKKFSSVWIPIRTAMGTALVIPINGYCGMQMLVMWLILQGVGLADNVWSSLVGGNALMTGTVTTAAYKSPEINKLANSILKASICVKAAELNRQITGSSDPWTKYSPDADHIWYGAAGSALSKSSCGEIILLSENAPDAATPSMGEFSNIQATVGTTADTLPIIQAHNNATKEMADYLFGQADAFVEISGDAGSKTLNSKVSTFPSGVITTAVNAYATKMTAATTAYYATQDKDGQSIKQNAGQEGWIMAGAWFIKLSSQMSKATTALSGVPKATANSKIKGFYYDEVNKVLLFVDDVLAKDPMNQKSGLAKQNAQDASGSDGLMAGFARWLATVMTSIDISDIGQQTNVHPIIQMKQMGDRMVTAATTSMFALIALWSAIAAGLGAAGVGLGGGLTGAPTTISGIVVSSAIFISPIAFTLFGSLITLGFFLAYYIPMIPFLIWLGCLIGWFIMVMEAVIAAPLWAVMHLHPSGDDVTGKGGNGYMLVLGLLVRPTLMIFGLACALVLSMVFGQFINSVFYDVFKMSRAGDTVGFFGTILAYVLYTTMMITFMHKMFSVIHVIPDQLLRWIGGGGEQLGQYAGALVQGTEGQFMKGGAAMGALGNQALQSGLGASQRIQQAAGQRANTIGDAARGAGMTSDQARDFASKSGEKGFDALKAANSMAESRQQLQAAGATPAELAKFNQDAEQAMNSKSEGGGGMTFQEGMASAKGSFYDSKFGAGAGEMISQVSSGGNPAQAKNAETRASGTLQKAQSTLGENYGSYMSDIKAAVGSGGVASSSGGDGGGPAFNNPQTSFSSPEVASTVAGYKSSSGNTYSGSFNNGQPTADTYRTAMTAVARAYGVEHGPGSDIGGGNDGNRGGDSTPTSRPSEGEAASSEGPTPL